MVVALSTLTDTTGSSSKGGGDADVPNSFLLTGGEV